MSNSDANSIRETSISLERLRFSAGIAGYRIIRLAMELFLILRVQQLDLPVSLAGNIFVLYSISSIATSFLFLIFPSLCFGSVPRAIALVILSVGCMTVGFIGTFLVDSSYELMFFFAFLTGIGTTAWNINFQSLTNIGFPEEQLGSVALLRQFFECIGFLLPSICLAVVSSVSIDDTFPLTIVSLCACCLGAVSLFFCLLSADRIITIASTVSSDAIHDKQSLRESFRSFFCSSVMKYFLGNALLLSMSNLLMASMSLITENYFGLSATHLWIGALGFPIGGMISVARRTTIPKDQRNSKTSVLSGSTKLFILVAICLGATPYAPPQTETVAKSMLFFFGLVTGMVYSVTFASSIELWLLKLNEFGVSFVSRATVINNFGAQAMIATIFQIQTVAVDNIADTSSENGISWTETLVYFAPHMILSLIVIALYYTIPNPPNCHSMWPRAPIQLWGRLTIRTLKLIPGMSSVSKSLLFSGFQQNRMAIMMENKDNMSIESGSIIPEKSELSPAGLESYLQCFDLLQTRDTWWRAPEAELSDILLDNQTALERRLHLIGEATQSIAILTWVFEDSTAGQRIADALIERANAGIDVKVIVDGVTVQYLKEEKQLLGTKKLGMLEYLVKNGVQVGSLESWVEELDSRFVVGTHRKVMIVDASYLLTGGRNINDKYYIDHEFHYRDADVVLWGDFDGTLAWFRELWHKAERLPHKPEGRKLLVASCRSTQSALEDGLDSEGTRTELRCGRSSTIIAMDFGLVTLLHEEDDHIEDAVTDAEAASTFVSTSVRHDALPTSSANNQTVSVFELNHEAGNVQSGNSGHDITFSTLIYLVNTAQTSIDLVMGYFQLFPALHDALTRAAARGVTVRLLTNSSSTHGLPSQSKVFGETIGKLLKLGIEVYVPDAKVEGKEKVDYTLHYKVVVVDGKAGMFGSWNCIGTSIFFDADYSVVLFSHDDGGHSNIFDRIKALFHDSSYTRLESISKGSFEVPFIYKLLANKYGRRVMERGY